MSSSIAGGLKFLDDAEIKKEIQLQKKNGINVTPNDFSRRELVRILSLDGVLPISDSAKDAMDGIPPIYAVLSKVRLTSSILNILTTPQLRDELKNQGVKITTRENIKEEDIPRAEIMGVLMKTFAKEGKIPVLPYTEPFESLIRSLTCPSLFGLEISYTSNNETIFLTLTRGNVLQMSLSAIKAELKNQGVRFEDGEDKIVLVDRLIAHLRSMKNVNHEFSKPFQAFIEARKTILEEDSTQKYLQAVQMNPQLLIPKVSINLDDVDNEEQLSGLKGISQGQQVATERESPGLIGGVKMPMSYSLPPVSYAIKENKFDRLVKIASSI